MERWGENRTVVPWGYMNCEPSGKWAKNYGKSDYTMFTGWSEAGVLFLWKMAERSYAYGKRQQELFFLSFFFLFLFLCSCIFYYSKQSKITRQWLKSQQLQENQLKNTIKQQVTILNLRVNSRTRNLMLIA